MKYPVSYLVEIQYLGFRFHGWAKQPGVKTIHEMIDRTVRFVLGHDRFRTLGTSRTDAMVSALHSGFQLFMHEPLTDTDEFLNALNSNLPSDIRAQRISALPEDFNIIQSPKTKLYAYSFYTGKDHFPFSSPFMAHFPEELDIQKMREGAAIYRGWHDFRNYTVKPSEKTEFRRQIIQSVLDSNDIYHGSIFPVESYVLRLSSGGFLRQQVRIMMGQLVMLGRGEISFEDFRRSLQGEPVTTGPYIAPASGLLLERIDFGV